MDDIESLQPKQGELMSLEELQKMYREILQKNIFDYLDVLKGRPMVEGKKEELDKICDRFKIIQKHTTL